MYIYGKPNAMKCLDLSINLQEIQQIENISIDIMEVKSPNYRLGNFKGKQKKQNPQQK